MTRIYWDGELPGAIRNKAFPCWCCGGKTKPMHMVMLNSDGTISRHRLATRICEACDVTELRLKEPYYPQARVSRLKTPDGDLYVDHSVTHLPSPG